LTSVGQGAERIFIDPYHRGEVLNRAGCRRVVQTLSGGELDLQSTDLEPYPPLAILTRVLTNLKWIYWRQQDQARTLRTIELILTLDPSSLDEQRDRGLILFDLGEFGRAADDLEAYLQGVQRSVLVDGIEDRLRLAKRALALLN
jgi:regulator of sirC expression with transglutaminase-like and TPR domain